MKPLLPTFLTYFIFYFALSIGCKDKENNPNPNGLIVYTSSADHRYGEIYSCLADGSKNERISNLSDKTLTDAEYWPELSEDGNLVKWHNAVYNVEICDLNSKNITAVDKAWSSCWIDNGKRIAYIQFGLDNSIYVYDISEKVKSQLTEYDYLHRPIGDSIFSFRGLQWWSTEKKIISTTIYNDVNHLVTIDPISGRIVEMYAMEIPEKYSLKGNLLTWINSDSIFIYDLKSKIKSAFSVANDNSPANPVLSPDLKRIAYTVVREYEYNFKKYLCTDIITCNWKGFDRREVTVHSDIPDSYKYKAVLSPFWVSNNELLFSAGNIYLIKDNPQTVVQIIGKALKAGGQIQGKF